MRQADFLPDLSAAASNNTQKFGRRFRQNLIDVILLFFFEQQARRTAMVLLF
jgi:hypothetical protein